MIVPAKIESKLQYSHNDGAIEFYPHRGRWWFEAADTVNLLQHMFNGSWRDLTHFSNCSDENEISPCTSASFGIQITLHFSYSLLAVGC